MVNLKGIGKKNRRSISYPSIPSAIRPVPHSDDFSPPVFNGFASSENEIEVEDERMEYEYKRTDTESEDSSTESQKATAQQFNQSKLNDLVRDLDLSKQAAEILASRLNEKHVLHSSAKVSYFRKSDEHFITFFKEEKQLIYCDNLPGLFGQLGISSYNPEEWRLFMDSSKRSLKCMLLHNQNSNGTVPIGYSTVLKEQQQYIRTEINLMKYHKHNWIIRVDLKMVSLLLGQQKGYTNRGVFREGGIGPCPPPLGRQDSIISIE